MDLLFELVYVVVWLVFNELLVSLFCWVLVDLFGFFDVLFSCLFSDLIDLLFYFDCLLLLCWVLGWVFNMYVYFGVGFY